MPPVWGATWEKTNPNFNLLSFFHKKDTEFLTVLLNTLWLDLWTYEYSASEQFKIVRAVVYPKVYKDILG